jgi:predicted metal-binding protein
LSDTSVYQSPMGSETYGSWATRCLAESPSYNVESPSSLVIDRYAYALLRNDVQYIANQVGLGLDERVYVSDFVRIQRAINEWRRKLGSLSMRARQANTRRFTYRSNHFWRSCKSCKTCQTINEPTLRPCHKSYHGPRNNQELACSCGEVRGFTFK